MIVFVYDTQCCTEEEDDPANAVLYFHPGWVSDTQRHALAGQVSVIFILYQMYFIYQIPIWLNCILRLADLNNYIFL